MPRKCLVATCDNAHGETLVPEGWTTIHANHHPPGSLTGMTIIGEICPDHARLLAALLEGRLMLVPAPPGPDDVSMDGAVSMSVPPGEDTTPIERPLPDGKPRG